MSKSKPGTLSFNRLVEEATLKEAELRSLDDRPRLSAEAFMREALTKAGMDEAGLEKLRQRYEAMAGELPACRGFLKDVEAILKEGRYSRVPSITRMAPQWRDDAATQIQGIGGGLYGLFCVAVQNVAHRHPEVFGDIEDMDVHQSRIDELRRKRNELFSQIATGFSAADLHIGDINPDGLARITFALCPTVTVAPQRDCAERLINELLKARAIAA